MNLLDRISDLNDKISYVEGVLNGGGLAAWEVKEYESLVVDYQTELAVHQATVAANPHLF